MNYSTQQQKVLALLKQGKVNSYELTYKHQIKQAPTRVKELRDLGYTILSVTKSDRSVDYYLDTSPTLKTTPLKSQPEEAKSASKAKNPNKGRTIHYFDSFGNKGVEIL